MKALKLLIIITLTITAISCNKVIDLKLDNNSGKLVIEGNIIDINGPQYITLSQNVPFTSTNSYPPVTGATVTVSDGKGNTYPFTEGPAGTYINGVFAGIAGNTYTMTVTTGGVTYSAGSIMPPLVPLDSITSKPNVFDPSKNRRTVSLHFKDPSGVANQYRFLMYVNNKQVNSILAIDDEFIDGRYINLDVVQNGIDIFPGDSVKVEMQCIDKPIYTYWYALSRQAVDGPGGGVAPSNPPTNITPASLGYFSAHTTQSKTIVVK